MPLDSSAAAPRLLFRVKPERLEPLNGVLLRLAELNGYERLGWITGMAGLNYWCATQADDFETLANLVGIPAGQLRHAAYRPAAAAGSPALLFLGTAVPKPHLRPHMPKICPDCIHETGYVSALWDLSLMAVCPVHKAILIDRCSECGRPVSWRRRGLLICGCRHVLTDVPLTASSPEAIALASAIAQTAGADLSLDRNLPSIVPEFGELSLSDQLAAALLLGSHAPEFSDTHDPRRRGQYLCGRLDAAGMHDLMEAAGKALTRWPIGFYEFLERLRGRLNDHQHGTGLARDFGTFYHALYRGRASSSLAFLQAAFESYLSQVWDNGFIGRKNTRLTSGEAKPKFVTRAIAAKRLNARPETVDRLILHGGLKGASRKMGSRRLLLVDRESLESYIADRQLKVSLAEAAHAFGTTRASLMYCIDSKLLTPIKEANGSLTVSRAELDTLIRRLRSMVVHHRGWRHQQCTFQIALRRLSFFGIGAADLLSLILRKKLVPISCSRKFPGASGLIFDAADIVRLSNARRRRPASLVTITQAAWSLSLPQKVAYSLADREILKTTSVHERGTEMRLVAPAALRHFRSAYISAAELADRTQVSPAHAVRTLRAMQVLPATGPSVDGGIQYFYRRRAGLLGTLKKGLTAERRLASD